MTAVGGGDGEADSTSTVGLPDLVEYHIAPPNTTVEAARPIVRLLNLIGGREELGIDPFGAGDCIEGSGRATERQVDDVNSRRGALPGGGDGCCCCCEYTDTPLVDRIIGEDRLFRRRLPR